MHHPAPGCPRGRGLSHFRVPPPPPGFRPVAGLLTGVLDRAASRPERVRRRPLSFPAGTFQRGGGSIYGRPPARGRGGVPTGGVSRERAGAARFSLTAARRLVGSKMPAGCRLTARAASPWKWGAPPVYFQPGTPPGGTRPGVSLKLRAPARGRHTEPGGACLGGRAPPVLVDGTSPDRRRHPDGLDCRRNVAVGRRSGWAAGRRPFLYPGHPCPAQRRAHHGQDLRGRLVWADPGRWHRKVGATYRTCK
jgi:hypothetical protein